MVHILNKENTILNKFLAEIRSCDIQRDSMRFRRNLERIGEITAYEISRTLNYRRQVVETPLGEAEVEMIDDKIVLATILRAGLPYHQGMLNYFDDSESAFVTAYRRNKKSNRFDVKVEYVSSCNLEGKILILSDPMLATGVSAQLTYEALVEMGGEPVHTHFASVIASEQGVDYLSTHLPSKNTSIWVGAVDAELTSKHYIVPGIGDAGDLAFGKKL